MELTEEDIKLLNTRIGLKNLLNHDPIDIEKCLMLTRQEHELKKLQAKMIDLQDWVINEKKKVVILFEGRDAAGKGGTIRRITAHIKPRHYRSVALTKPTSEEKGEWYFQRYVNKLPRPGEMVFFDRSWYNRAVVEPVNGFCTPEEYQRFMGQVNDFERMIVESDTYLFKFFLMISKEEQSRRFDVIEQNPLTRWKLTAVDKKAQELWQEYSHYEEEMFKKTDTERATWIKIDANGRYPASLAVCRHILEKMGVN